MRKFFSFFLILGVSFYFVGLVAPVKLSDSVSDKGSVGSTVLNGFVQETGSSNAVTSVVVTYRGFDTLGEVTVLFLSALGLSLLLSGGILKDKKMLLHSFILENGLGLTVPFILLFGVYVILHGHLSPGGGFPGGVIIATGLFSLVMTGIVSFKGSLFSVIEGLAGLSFILLGLIGFFGKGYFLANTLPMGTVGNLLSAGIIPFLYAVVGVKVATEITGLAEHSFLYSKKED